MAPTRDLAGSPGRLYPGPRRLRTIDSYIYTVAGNGSGGSTGDGGQATAADLNFPDAATVDKSGNLYFVDTDNGCPAAQTHGNAPPSSRLAYWPSSRDIVISAFASRFMDLTIHACALPCVSGAFRHSPIFAPVEVFSL